MSSFFKLRDYQIEISNKAANVLKINKIVYLTMEVRTGKTFTALQTADNFGAQRVLFLTKKKAIESIQNDFNQLKPSFDITIINDESLHLINQKFDLVIHDEHHRFGAFPKPNKAAVLFKKRYGSLPMIFLSGTPTPENHSQWFHQFWVSNNSPFKNYVNFYKWANDYVNVTERNLGYAKVKVYDDGIKSKILPVVEPYLITYTQQEAGFTSKVDEFIIEVEMQPITYEIIKRLKRDNIVTNTNGDVILGDTGAKLMQKIHQLSSGTCKFEDGSSKIIDTSKAEKIFELFKNKKIGIFYKFVEEYKALKQIFGDQLTDNLEGFNTTDKSIALQIVSGREGISLKQADCLVYYNIDFSATSYWQSRDRLTTMERKENSVYWIFAKNGIEYKIYDSVLKKKNFTLDIFKKVY
jgi:hypothetical protein